MAVPDAVLAAEPRGPRAVRARAIVSRLSRSPGLWPALAVLGAWVTLLALGRQAGGAGMAMGPRQQAWWSQAVAGLPPWMLMTIAMMGPAVTGCAVSARAGA